MKLYLCFQVTSRFPVWQRMEHLKQLSTSSPTLCDTSWSPGGSESPPSCPPRTRQVTPPNAAPHTSTLTSYQANPKPTLTLQHKRENLTLDRVCGREERWGFHLLLQKCCSCLTCSWTSSNRAQTGTSSQPGHWESVSVFPSIWFYAHFAQVVNKTTWVDSPEKHTVCVDRVWWKWIKHQLCVRMRRR